MEEKNGFKLPISEYYERKKEEAAEARVAKQIEYEDIVTYPKALAYDTYNKISEKAIPNSKDWYISLALEKYATAVKNFYCSVMYAFNNTIFKPIELPNYVKASNKCEFNLLAENLNKLEELSVQLGSAERNLLSTLEKNNTSFSARANKYPIVKELTQYAATAWLMYNNMKVDNFFHAVVDFKARNEDKDMTIDRNVALVSMGHYKTESFVNSKVNNYFATKGIKTPFKDRYGSRVELYEHLNAKELFFNLMEMFNGYNYEKNKETLTEQQQNVMDSKALAVIEFYQNYADVKDVYKSVFRLIKKLDDGDSVNFLDEDYLIEHNVRRDVYIQANQYLKQINNLTKMAKENSEYTFVLKDCEHIEDKLSKALNYMQPHHKMFTEERNRVIENFKKNGFSGLMQ